MRIFHQIVLLGLLAGSAYPQAIPGSVLGRWRIERVLASQPQACWDAARAKTLVGAALQFAPGKLTGPGGETPVTETLSRTLSRRKFQDEYGIDLAELNIKAAQVTELDLQHEDADFTGATTEVPGDTVVLAGPGRIVVSACGVYYLAVKGAR